MLRWILGIPPYDRDVYDFAFKACLGDMQQVSWFYIR